jgi:hypothetical protein
MLTAVALTTTAACRAGLPAGPGLPTPNALVELRLDPPRDVAARRHRETIWLTDVATLTGRVEVGSTTDTIEFILGDLRRADGVREANLPRGLLVRLPRDPASGVSLRVLTRDTRPGVTVFLIVLLSFLAGAIFIIGAAGGT